MDIYKKLLRIQQTLKVPKTQYNSFGKYKYRKAEDILEAAKPLAHAEGCVLILADNIATFGDRYYVKATASLISTENEEERIEVSSYAREEQSKSGMDGSQITGGASSYARKYALNGLLAIDDSADSDATNNGEGVNSVPVTAHAPAPAPSPAPTVKKTLTEQDLKKWALSAAKGTVSKKDGRTAREVFMETFVVSDDQLAAFDIMVAQLKKGMNVK